MNKLKGVLFLWVPLAVTIVWVFVVSLKVYNHLQVSPRILGLNGLGDFVAGAMSPLAIFWLVMVYLQQRKEMREQVAQTKFIAIETRKQVEVMEKDLAIQHEPLFVCHNITQVTGDGPHRANIQIINVGGVALYLNVKDHNGGTINIDPSSYIQTDQLAKMSVPFQGKLDDADDADDAFIYFEYENRFGRKSKYKCFFGKGATKEDFFVR